MTIKTLCVFPALFVLLINAPIVAAQDRTLQPGVECSSNAAFSATREAFKHSDRGDHEKALAAYKRAVQLEPTCAATYQNLGTGYYKLRRHEEAIAAYQHALQFNPSWAWVIHLNMGRSFAAIARLDAAINAYSETIRLKPKEALAYHARAALYLRTARGDAAALDAQAYLRLRGLRDKNSLNVVLIAYFGFRQVNQEDRAQNMLDEAAKAKKSDWPYPVIRYLRKEISEQELIAFATDTDKMTEARTYIGLTHSFSGKTSEALPHLEWVKENGKETFFEYKLALSELERIDKKR